jgi:SNF2 family DNA or RNA helicase
MKLEQIQPNCRLKGILPSETVSVKQARMVGDQASEITYVDAAGRPGSQLIFREQENQLEILDQVRPLGFDSHPDLFRLVSEAHRIRLGYLFDPMIAVNTSAIDPLPHQITAVYETMLNRHPLRFLLADDPGAGKTIMTGLLIKELVIRGDVAKCLIVAPGGLVEQWQDELVEKFNLYFDIMTNDGLEASRTGNWFHEHDFCLCRLDKLSRNEDLQEKLKTVDWDLVIFDEAHKLSASYFGSEVKYTKRFRLGQLLSEHTRQFLLLTATPHNGKEEDFQLFMSLLDGDRFEGKRRDALHTQDTSDLMRRMVKEQLVTMDNKPLFPKRFAYTVHFKLSDPELDLYTRVTDYVREEFNRADKLENEGRRGTVGFALTILQRRLASSPEAIYQSLRRRRERLEKRLREERLLQQGRQLRLPDPTETRESTEEVIERLEDLEDAPEQELEKAEESIIDLATTAMTIAELEMEIDTLKRLEALALQVRRSGNDTKWIRLSETLQGTPEMHATDGQRRKLVIFTEQRDTLNYLVEKLTILEGNPQAIVSIHGQTPRDKRRQIQEAFTNDPEVKILVATDAAGEGINLQRAHLMVNYDLPWNPNRLEQRFGRIHRIGQRDVCHLWNLVAENTREGDVFLRLLSKLEQERQSLGGAVFDVLGQVFLNQSLKELLIKAIRDGERQEVRDYLNQVISEELDTRKLKKLIDDRSLATEALDENRVQGIREMMERAQARKLQPHYIGSFFEAAFQHLGGELRRREPDRWEIRNVPSEIRLRDRVIGTRAPVLKSYERVTFRKESIRVAGKPPAALVAPGHPLLDAVIDLILEKNRDLMRQGTILIDPADTSSQPRVLLYLESAISDSRHRTDLATSIISRRLHFVEIGADGKTQMAGYAPYLDYTAPDATQLEKIHPLLDAPWLVESLEKRATEYAVGTMVPEHLKDVRVRREALIQKTKEAVHERLTKEIIYWNQRAQELQEKEESGKSRSRLNSGNARDRAERLAERLNKRMADLDSQKNIAAHPPTILGGALVVPIGYFQQIPQPPAVLEGSPLDLSRNNKLSEQVAMNKVMEAEKAKGFIPRDVSAENRGYDIESRDPATGHLRFLEVKGRHSEADTVTVTRNEILTALNKPESYYLVLVLIDGDGAREPVYLKTPFKSEPDFATASVNFKIEELAKQPKIMIK